jgi:hypothetical protein
MVWGQSGMQRITDLVDRLRKNDPNLKEIHILKHRVLDDASYEVCSCHCSRHAVRLAPPRAATTDKLNSIRGQPYVKLDIEWLPGP